MLARHAAITIIDFETTGAVQGLPAEPWQVGIVRIREGELRPETMFSSLLRVPLNRPFSRYAPGQHSALRQEIAHAPALAELWLQLRQWVLGAPLAGHSIGTERKCLEQAFPLHAFGPWLDTLKLVRIAYPQLRGHGLAELVDELGLTDKIGRICPGRGPHDALFDAVASAVLLQSLLALPGWEEVTVDALVGARALTYHRLRAERD